MPVQPDTDHGLKRTAAKQNTTGSRLLLLGGILFALGVITWSVGDGGMNFVGVVFAALATPPTLAGVALMLSGLVGKRSAEHKPFA